MQCSKAVTNSVIVVSEKHILQLKFLQKLPIDNQKIKKKRKLWGRNLSMLWSSHRVSPTNWEFHVLLYKKVNHKKWHPVQVPLAWSVCMVICTETQTPDCSDHINNQTFVKVSTRRSDRMVTWVDEIDFEFFCDALQQYMDYTSLFTTHQCPQRNIVHNFGILKQ